MEIKTLTTREVNCSELTAEMFASMMIADMKKAKEVYDSIWYPIELDAYNKRIESIKVANEKHARAYAEKKWKTEKKRNEYVEKVVSSYVPYEFKYWTITFFDFKVEPWSNGISGNCILSYDKMTEDAMIKCFNTIKDNKYFKVAKGWILEDHHHCRPQIKLILDESVEAEFKKDEENLGNAIAEFYKGTNYWGD